MKANPGGVIDPSHVYGRDGLIAELWRQLDQTVRSHQRGTADRKNERVAEDGARGGAWLVPCLARPRTVPFGGGIRGRACTSKSSNT